MLPMLLGAIGAPLLQGALAGTALAGLSTATLGAGIAGLTSLAQGNPLGRAAFDALGGGSAAGAVGSLAKVGAAGAPTVMQGASAVPSAAPSLAEKVLTAGGGSSSVFTGAPSLQTAAASLPAPAATGVNMLSNAGAGLKDLLSEGGAQRFTDITGRNPMTAVGLPAYGLLASAARPKPVNPEEQSLGFGPFTPISELRRRNEERGYAMGGIASLNPMSGMFDARARQPQYGETQGTFKKGGYLDGPGDGMSDSIPASIEGKQPARLADGEFVVAADVVSHLGNGSSKAGAKRLYAMMDKVRSARTGTKKQGKQIKAEKYMPA